MNAMNNATVDIETPPLGDFGYDEADGGVGDDDEVEEVDASTVKQRGVNYTVLEDENLIRAWESVSLDSIHGTDQTNKRYWQ